MMLKPTTFQQAKQILYLFTKIKNLFKPNKNLFTIFFTFSALIISGTGNSAPMSKIHHKQDSDYPMQIVSDTAEFNDETGTATYKGKVVVTQGSRKLLSNVLIIYRGNDNEIKKMIATGSPAKIKAQPNPQKPIGTGEANIIKYYPREDKAELIGKAELQQNGDLIKGPFLTYFFEKGLLISNPMPKGRTTVILQPKKDDKN